METMEDKGGSEEQPEDRIDTEEAPRQKRQRRKIRTVTYQADDVAADAEKQIDAQIPSVGDERNRRGDGIIDTAQSHVRMEINDHQCGDCARYLYLR